VNEIALRWIWALGGVLAVSAIPLLGLLLAGKRFALIQQHLMWLVSFAVGALLGGALIHLLPEAYQTLGSGPALTGGLLTGFLGFFVLEKFLWHHAHHHDPEVRPSLPPLAALNLLGDLIHNVIDGMLIAAAFLADVPLGIATTAAVIVHEIPQEVGDFGVLLHAGLPMRRVVWLNFVSGLGAVGGALLVLAIGDLVAGFDALLLPVAAGSFLYIAASDLIPELHRERRPAAVLQQILLVLLGVAVMAGTAVVLG
jgi:zinc and cadmium transporter